MVRQASLKLCLTVVTMFGLAAAAACATSHGIGGDGEPPPGAPDGAAAFPTGDECRGRGTVSGTVFDPSGITPLYNVFVYVASEPLEPLEPGLSPTCTPCQGKVSGAPVSHATTDVNGHFELADVPAGADVPLVMQIGKWRRRVVLPEVKACVNNAVEDRNLTRLPRNHAEGDIPRIAVTTGVDFYECVLLSRIGLDPEEFTSPRGEGRVHTFLGQDTRVRRAFPNGWGEADELFGDLEAMKKYDVILNSCEGRPLRQDTKGPAYANMKAYLDSGGRVFANHWQVGWFAPPDADATMCEGGTCNGPPEFASMANWFPRDAAGPVFINTSLPKGDALDRWQRNALALHGLPLAPPGQMEFQSADRYWGTLVGAVNAPASNWMYQGDPSAETNSIYLSFNTPVGAPPAQQCGRAHYFDGHASFGVVGSEYHEDMSVPFPDACSLHSDAWVPRGLLAEFMFFDLSACVDDGSQSPRQPH